MSKIGPSSVPGKKAGPNGSFPIGDKKHARLAIGGATRSERAGNISESTADSIKAKARAKLGEGRDGKHNGPEMGKTPTADPNSTQRSVPANHKAEHNDNGMLKAMSAHADREHPVK